MSECRDCKAPLVSTVEIFTNACINCIKKNVEELRIVKENLDLENSRFKKLAEQVGVMQKKVDEYKSYMKAEVDGITASERHLDESENPHPAGNPLCAMWLNGWQLNETRRLTAQSLAVIKWSTENLDIIKELAVGTGSQEIADKIDSVNVKLKQFVQRED